MKQVLVIVITVLFCTTVWATEENFSFDDPATRAAFLRLTEELRCPMCQNQNIADSNAMIAHDMRRKVYTLLKDGKSEQEVIDYMKARYGDFVHYQPPVTAATMWLWALPVLFIIIAMSVVLIRRRNVPDNDNIEEKLAKADAMLKQEKE